MQTAVKPPNSVRYGVFALLASVLLGALCVAILDAANVNRNHPDLWLWIPFVIINGFFCCFLLLIWRRRNWARWIVLVWCVADWVATVWLAYSMPYEPALAMALAFAELIVYTFGCWLLFKQTSSSWFRVIGTAS